MKEAKIVGDIDSFCVCDKDCSFYPSEFNLGQHNMCLLFRRDLKRHVNKNGHMCFLRLEECQERFKEVNCNCKLCKPDYVKIASDHFFAMTGSGIGY